MPRDLRAELKCRVFAADGFETLLGAFQFALQTTHLSLTFRELVKFLDAVQQRAFVIFDQAFRTLLQVAHRGVRVLAVL